MTYGYWLEKYPGLANLCFTTPQAASRIEHVWVMFVHYYMQVRQLFARSGHEHRSRIESRQ